MVLVLPFENIHVSQNAEWKTQTKIEWQLYRVVHIRENDCRVGNDLDFEEKDNQTH